MLTFFDRGVYLFTQRLSQSVRTNHAHISPDRVAGTAASRPGCPHQQQGSLFRKQREYSRRCTGVSRCRAHAYHYHVRDEHTTTVPTQIKLWPCRRAVRRTHIYAHMDTQRKRPDIDAVRAGGGHGLRAPPTGRALVCRRLNSISPHVQK